jgi:hypothetical protein
MSDKLIGKLQIEDVCLVRRRRRRKKKQKRNSVA